MGFGILNRSLLLDSVLEEDRYGVEDLDLTDRSLPLWYLQMQLGIPRVLELCKISSEFTGVAHDKRRPDNRCFRIVFLDHNASIGRLWRSRICVRT